MSFFIIVECSYVTWTRGPSSESGPGGLLRLVPEQAPVGEHTTEGIAGFGWNAKH